MSAYTDVLADCPAVTPRAVSKDAPVWAVLRFVARDGAELWVDRRWCPRQIPARGHWLPSGACRCGDAA